MFAPGPIAHLLHIKAITPITTIPAMTTPMTVAVETEEEEEVAGVVVR